MSGFSVDHDQLTTHAGHVEEVGRGVQEAADAVDTIHLDGGAFGVMCAVIPAVIGGFTATNAAAVHAASSALARTAEGLRSMAATYHGCDSATATWIESLGTELDGSIPGAAP